MLIIHYFTINKLASYNIISNTYYEQNQTPYYGGVLPTGSDVTCAVIGYDGPL